MRAHPVQSDPIRTNLVVFGQGEDVIEGLQAHARDVPIKAGRVGPGIGAFSEAVLAFYNPETQEYEEIPVEEQTEVLSLTGNIAQYEGAPRLHLHASLSRRTGECVGGHLLRGTVAPTLEVFVTRYEAPLERTWDEASGLPLLPR